MKAVTARIRSISGQDTLPILKTRKSARGGGYAPGTRRASEGGWSFSGKGKKKRSVSMTSEGTSPSGTHPRR